MTAILEFFDVLIVCFVICATRLVLCSDIVVGVWMHDLLFIFISPLVHKYLCLVWVIPNHFNKSFYMTLSELDKTWCVSSVCGFMKPDEVSLLFVVWLLGKGPLNIPVFSNFCHTDYYLNPCNFHIFHLIAK